MDRPLQVYLDSDDFSLLSDPRRMDQVLQDVRDDLQRYADAGAVQFRFSMAHVCEAAPTVSNAQAAAERRAALIKSLCGRNTLASIEEIWDAEVASEKEFMPFTDGRWFPPLDDLLPDSPFEKLKAMLSEDLKAKGFTREQRRQQERKAFSKKGLTGGALSQMEAAMPGIANDLIAVFPLERHEIEALKSYYRGGPGREVVVLALQRLLSDATWFIQRFAADPEKMRGVTAWLRQGGTDFLTNMAAAANGAAEFFRDRKEYEEKRQAEINVEPDLVLQEIMKKHLVDGKKQIDRLVGKTRTEMEEKILRRIAARPGARAGLAEKSLNQIREACPGIAATVAMGMHATKRAIEEVQPRPLKASDFGDAMHATYAPYVDIYRTDGFMADAVDPILKLRGVVLARRLRDLPGLIDERLGRKDFQSQFYLLGRIN